MKPERINEDLTIHQNEGSLAYGTDAYLLSAYIRKQTKEKACEFGAGSGVISLLCLSRGKFSHITAVEIQETIASLAKRNTEENGFADKMDVICRDLRDLPHDMNESFGAVFSNPPYMTNKSGKLNENEADSMSRHEVNGTIREFTKTAAKLLKFGGLFYCVYRPDRLAELIFACKLHGLEPKRLTLVYPTADMPPCLMLLEAKKGAAEGMKTTKPLIIYKDGLSKTNENYTDDMKYIYQNGAFHDNFQRL